MTAVVSNRRIAAGAGLSLGAALGLTATAQAADFTVDNTNDPAGSGACLIATPGDCSLRQALLDANLNGQSADRDRVLFQSGLSGTITLTFAGLFVSDPVDIVGPGAKVSPSPATTSSGCSTRIRPWRVTPVTISGLTLTKGYGSGSVGGGGIYSKDTDLTIDSSTISDSVAGAGDFVGGGIRQINDQLLVLNSTISGNEGGNGGGIHAFNADVGIENSTISGNTATGTGGGSGYGYGGGVWLDKGTVGSLISYESTISGNHAVYGGGSARTRGPRAVWPTPWWPTTPRPATSTSATPARMRSSSHSAWSSRLQAPRSSTSAASRVPTFWTWIRSSARSPTMAGRRRR